MKKYMYCIAPRYSCSAIVGSAYTCKLLLCSQIDLIMVLFPAKFPEIHLVLLGAWSTRIRLFVAFWIANSGVQTYDILDGRNAEEISLWTL